MYIIYMAVLFLVSFAMQVCKGTGRVSCLSFRLLVAIFPEPCSTLSFVSLLKKECADRKRLTFSFSKW